MRSTIRVICTPALAAGFRLAGLAPIEMETPSEGARWIRSALRQADSGVLLVEDQVYGALSDLDRRALSQRPLPMVVPFPGPDWTRRESAPEEFITELLRQAIGYRVKLG